jgi:hypothetical protein
MSKKVIDITKSWKKKFYETKPIDNSKAEPFRLKPVEMKLEIKKINDK